MQSASRITLVILALMAIHVSAFATESGTLICKGGIVSIGDSAGEVIYKCGQPASTTQREQKNTETVSKVTRGRTTTIISIDDWIFNFGPDHFQYQLLLENGRVKHIESLGYGY